MAGNVLDIQIQDQFIDLFEEEIFTYTLQATDVISLTGSKANFTKTLEIPTTDNNNVILGNVDQITSQSVTPYRQLSTKVIQNGVEIIPEGFTIIESTTDRVFKITIYSGNINLSSLLELVSLRELDLGTFAYDITTAVALSNSAAGAVWGLCGYSVKNKNIFPNETDIRFSYFGAYINTILNNVFTRLGLTVTGLEAFTSPPFDDLVLPLVNRPLVTPLFQTRRFFSAKTSVSVQYDDTSFAVIFDDVVRGNVAGEYNNLTGSYASPTIFNGSVTYVVSGVKTGANGDAIFDAKYGPNEIWTSQTISSEGAFSFTISGDEIYKGGNQLFALQLTIAIGDTIDIDIGSSVDFRAYEEAATYENQANRSDGSPIDVARSLPDISAWDLIKSIREIYGAISETDTVQRKLSLLRFNDILLQQAVDWSNKLDVSRPASINFRSSALFQINDFKYTPDEEVFSFGEAVDAEIVIDDDNLRRKGTTVQSLFSPSPSIAIENFLTSKISLFTIEVENGECSTIGGPVGSFYQVFSVVDASGIKVHDTFILNGINGNVTNIDGTNNNITVYSSVTYGTITAQAYRIERMIASDKNIRIMQARNNTGGPINYANGASFISVSDFKIFNFFAEDFNVDLTWNRFIDDNYSLFANRIQQEKVLTAHFDLTEADIRNISFINPVYIEKYGNFFYLNAVNKYRIDQSTKCTLISLHFGFGGNEINDWINSGVNPYIELTSFRNVVLRAFQDTPAVLSEVNSNVFEVVENETYQLQYTLSYLATLGMNFTATQSADTAYTAIENILFDFILTGNEDLDYDPITGEYTFAGTYTGTFSTLMEFVDDAGGGSSTIEIFSSIQGVLASQVIPNNQTLSFTLFYFGNFAAGEVVSVRISVGAGVVSSGAQFKFLYESGFVPNIADVFAEIVNGIPISNRVQLVSGGVQTAEFIILNTQSAGALRLSSTGEVDYSAVIRLVKKSAGG